MKEKTTLVDVLRKIGPRQAWYLKIDTREIVNPFDYIKPYLPDNYVELSDEEIDKLNIPSLEDLHIYALPSYEKIDNRGIMRFYTKECVEDKKIRKALFNTLRNKIYVDKFCDVLKKYDLYEDYLDCSYDFYNEIIEKWIEKNNISFD